MATEAMEETAEMEETEATEVLQALEAMAETVEMEAMEEMEALRALVEMAEMEATVETEEMAATLVQEAMEETEATVEMAAMEAMEALAHLETTEVHLLHLLPLLLPLAMSSPRSAMVRFKHQPATLNPSPKSQTARSRLLPQVLVVQRVTRLSLLLALDLNASSRLLHHLPALHQLLPAQSHTLVLLQASA